MRSRRRYQTSERKLRRRASMRRQRVRVFPVNSGFVFRLPSRRWSTIVVVAAVLNTIGLAACGEAQRPDLKTGKFYCARNSQIYTTDTLSNVALREFLPNRRNPRGCRQYKTIAEFRAVNPHCCTIAVGRTTIDIDDDGRTEPVGKVNWNDSDRGYLVGIFRVRYLCGSADPDLGEARTSYSTISACGFLTEESSMVETKFTRGLTR